MPFFNILIAFVFLLGVSDTVLAQSVTMDSSKILVVVPLLKGSIDHTVFRKFDKIVPELRSKAHDKIIRLECRYSGNARNEHDVMSAYQVAAKMEKYLREHHKLNLDLWINIKLGPAGVNPSPALTISVFADDIKQLDSTVIVPAKSGLGNVEVQ